MSTKSTPKATTDQPASSNPFFSASKVLLPVAALAAGAGAVALADYTARSVSGTQAPLMPNYTFTPWELGLPFEEVRFQTDDGLTLAGWWMPHPDATRTIIGCTGHRGTKDGMLGIGSGLWRAGNNVFLFDFRSRGDSERMPMSLAYREQEDLRAAVAWVEQRAATLPIGVIGYSMGAAVALLVAARTPAIRAVVADSSFATMEEVLRDIYATRRYPQGVLPLADWLTQWRYGYRFNAVRPLDAVAQIAPRPIFFIHAAKDRLIPVKHGQALYAAASEPKELWVTPDGDHCGSYFEERPLYVERVTQFFERCLSD